MCVILIDIPAGCLEVRPSRREKYPQNKGSACYKPARLASKMREVRLSEQTETECTLQANLPVTIYGHTLCDYNCQDYIERSCQV